MALNIPERLKSTVIKILKLSGEDRSELLSAFLSVQINASSEAYEETVMESLPKYSEEEIEGFVRFFFSLSNLSEHGNPSKVAKDFVRAIRRFDDDEIEGFSDETFNEFTIFITSLLASSSNLKLNAKALRLMWQHDQIYLHSEIFSDIRPIFSQETPEAMPQSAVIIHKLKVNFRQNDEPKDMYFAMDYNDLQDLKASAERAIEKHKALSEAIKKFGTHIRMGERQ